MSGQGNLIIAVIVSLSILIGFQYFYEIPRMREARDRQAAIEQSQSVGPSLEPAGRAPLPGAPSVPGAVATPPAPSTAPTASGAAVPAPAPTPEARGRQLAEAPRVRIVTPRLHGSISLKGARLDDLTLATYYETIEPGSPEIVLLSPVGATGAYYAEFGWQADEAAGIKRPGPDTVWQTDGNELTAARPLRLRWDNGDGLRFIRTISVDENYMFSIRQRVENYGNRQVELYPYGLVSRSGTPRVSRFFILHEGPIGVFNETLNEVGYDDVRDEQRIGYETVGGWIGITDKFWLTALVPDQSQRVRASFSHRLGAGAIDRYQFDYIRDVEVVPAGAAVEVVDYLFAGAKEVKLLDGYKDSLGVASFDKAIDFGWFYFLTKPLFYLIAYFNKVLGNFGLAILLLTVIVKIIFFPLANKSYRAMSAMKKLQPEMTKLRERFGEDRARLNKEVMELYKREKANPVSGCLPIAIQIPVFFALYKVMFVTIEMRHAPFFGWIHDLSAPDPLGIMTVFGLFPWDPPGMLAYGNIGIWPIIMGASMWLQMRLNPRPPDPVQAKMFMVLPFVFTFMLGTFPAGLVIYWTWNNMLSIAQQWVIMKRAGIVNPAGS